MIQKLRSIIKSGCLFLKAVIGKLLRRKTMEDTLEVKRHIKYFERCLQVLPGRYASLDTNRMTVAFFAISGLDILDGLDKVKVKTADMIEWIYALQVLPIHQGDFSEMSCCGFRGSTNTGASFTHPQNEHIFYDSGHVAMTYTALCSLIILGDDLRRIDKQALAYGLKNLQLEDGSFQFCVEGSENDMRFLFCVASICYILNNFSTINVDKAVEYIMSSLSYEGGFGQGPFLEAHGGSTYCAVASLYLFERLDSLTTRETELLKQWCHTRQQTGFQGRPNKPVDTCYSFWIGATLKMLNSYQNIDWSANRAWLLSVQDYLTGGFGKWTTTSPDPLHSYMGLSGLTLTGEPGLETVYAPLNITKRAVDYLRKLQNSPNW